MMHTRGALLLSLWIVAARVLVACGRKQAEVVVATDATWPPFEMVNEQTKLVEGFDVDLMSAIAAEEGLELRWKNVGFDSLLTGMATGQYDAAISVITITDERKKSMLFTAPYYDAGQLIATRAESTDISSPASLAGKTAGAQLGTTGASEVEKIGGAKLKAYDDVAQAFMDLMNGQLDAVVADSPLVHGFVAKNPGKLKEVGVPFTTEHYGIAVKRGGEQLLTRVNSGLQKCKDKGIIAQLEQKWIKAGR